MGTIPVTSKSVKEVINYLDIRKLSGPDFILVVVLKNCEPKISYMLWTESCFPNCWKVLSMCLKLLKKGLQLRATASFVFSLFRIENQKKDFFNVINQLIINRPPDLFASDASVVFQRLLSISINDHFQECCLCVSFVFPFFFFVFSISNMEQTANFQEQREVLQGGSFQLQTSPQHFRKYRTQQTLSDTLRNKSPFKKLGIMYDPLSSKFKEALLEYSQGQMSQSV